MMRGNRKGTGQQVRRAALLCVVTVCLALLTALPAWSGFISPSAFIHLTDLDNGLQARLARYHELPLVTLRLGLPVGRLHDPAGKEGMAELLARNLIEARAGEVEALGGQTGAYVTNDYTVFWARGLAEDFKTLVSLLVRTVAEPQLGKAGLAVTRDRLRGELKLDQSMPGAVARRRLMEELYGDGHPLGRNVTMRSLGRTKLKEAHARLVRFYGAGGAQLVVVGDIEPQRYDAAVEAAAGEWARGERLPPVPAPEVTMDKPRVIRIPMKGLTQSSIIFGWPGIRRTDPDWERFLVFNHVLGSGGFASRLMQAVRVEEGRTYSIRSSADAGLTAGPVAVTTATAGAGTDATIATIRRELERLLKDGITDQELTDAREHLVGSYRLAQATPDGLAGMMISARMLGLGDGFIHHHYQRLDAVDAAGALQAGSRFLDVKNYVLVVVENPGK